MNAEQAVATTDRALVLVLAAFTFVTVYVVNLFPRFRNPNEFSRYELVVSMAERHSFTIDAELASLGDHEDKAVFGGHFYSNKAPGLSFAALPCYELLRPFLGPARPGHFTAMFFGIRLATVSAAALAALILLGWRLRRSCADPRMAPLILFAVAFGTPFLVYARSFFSHAWTAALLYIAFELLDRERRPGWAALSGLLAGWAVLSEYPAALAAAVLGLLALRRGGARAALFTAGALPAAALLAIYNRACFGGLLELSSRHEAFPQYTTLAHEKLFGFRLPSAGVALRYLFSASRGVLFQSPFFVLLPAAATSPALRGRARLASLGAAAVTFAAMCGYENWHGGWALGSRYLLPVLLLAAWPLAGVGEADGGTPAKVFFAVAAAYSAAYFFFSGLTFWCLPHIPALGVRFYSGYWLSRGWAAPTLGGGSLPAQLPVLLATAAAAASAFGAAFRDRGRALLLTAGGVLAFALFFAGPAPRADFGSRLTRAMILDGDSDVDPQRAELWRLEPEAKTPAEREAWKRAMKP